jgi:integrase
MAHDPMSFQAFHHVTTRMSVASSLSTQEPERTQLPPDFQVCWLVDAALRLVLSCEAHFTAMQDTVQEAFRLFPRCKLGVGDTTTEMRRVGTQRTQYLGPRLNEMIDKLRASIGSDAIDIDCIKPVYQWRQPQPGATKAGLDVRDLLFLLLPAACSVIIAALTARRNSEIISLREDCVVEEPDGEAYLSVWIEKTLRDLSVIPVPAAVVRAVEVLRWLSEEARAGRTEPWIFLFKDPGANGPNIHFSMNSALKAFAEFAAVPPLPDGSYWEFRSHQFRVFSVLHTTTDSIIHRSQR